MYTDYLLIFNLFIYLSTPVAERLETAATDFADFCPNCSVTFSSLICWGISTDQNNLNEELCYLEYISQKAFRPFVKPPVFVCDKSKICQGTPVRG